jgi:hypothetical protein
MPALDEGSRPKIQEPKKDQFSRLKDQPQDLGIWFLRFDPSLVLEF